MASENASIVDEWLEDDKLMLLEAWARDGYTYVDIADRIGIAPSTLRKWRTQYEEIDKALMNVENVMLDKLEECIISREKETKGTSRAKLTNWKKYVGAKHVEAFGLDYRWGLVYSMIKEIKEGLDNGK